MPQIGPMELIIILAILLLLFGAKKLPELARSIGSSAGELKKGMDDVSKTPGKSASDVDSKQG
ncbi:MAG TPA: twin-arginine translocase TatA/TatE family subunit [Candidatus Saccharimonadales bacterium]|jgi:sec-independent protein translocase protein TatA